MNSPNLLDASEWAHAFGLAPAPLFSADEHSNPEKHHVMLDGGHGTFALSINADTGAAVDHASWIWSSDIPHHVAVGNDRVVVTRWDKVNEPRSFTTGSVSQRFGSFYRYLVNDRVEQRRTVVDHLVSHFRSVRTAVAHAGESDDLTLGVFLSLLSDQASQNSSRPDLAAEDVVPAEAKKLYFRLKQRQLEPLLSQIGRHQFSASHLDLHSALAVRHAGGLIFQEAHFELMRIPSPDLFGSLEAPSVKPITRGGAHFTPPSLARSVVEQAISQIDDLSTRRSLVLADPACGSGAFLHEAIRALQRAGFAGHLKVVGRDISRHAVAMAQFVVHRAASDWQSSGSIDIDISIADSLEDDTFPKADVIVMNPPFVAVGSLSAHQQEQIDRILGPLKKGRPDLSMAFLLHAVQQLNKGGVLGCLMPASLLELQAAEPWRKTINEIAGIRFLALFGDHGLFAYALVQVAAAVFKNAPTTEATQVLTVWTGNEREATGEALRALRGISRKGSKASEEREQWRVSWLPSERFSAARMWQLQSRNTDRLVSDVRQTTPSTVGDLFEVRQGILTGDNDAFVISPDEWRRLPQLEQQYFLPAIMNRSITMGSASITNYVFYPYREGRLVLDTEADLSEAVPNYYKEHLLPNKARLAARSSISRRGSEQWWALTERRSWMDRQSPRIISKYFGSVGSFAADFKGTVGVVQGYAWYPTKRLLKTWSMLDRSDLSTQLIAAYAALLNTRVFARLLSTFSPRVAGGQF